ncbi:MAG: aldehyde ferredoxin oxidoreductase family protein [Promethearchaeota archaeon]
MITNKKYFGFTGKLLKINLTNNSITTESLNINHGKDFMGGAGYACRYLFDLINKDTDPLSPQNILMIMTGPFCLTNAPSLSRMAICSKSPYTGLWGEANAGGFFGPELKKAGYDGIIITGKAEKPVILKIFDNNAEILDASDLWGKGTKETHEILKKRYGDLKSKVLCIGQAGENLIKYAIINSEGRAAGRTGMGAIMGSKNLKGIIVKGKMSKPQIANPEGFKDIVRKTTKYILNTTATKGLREFGTSAGVVPFHSVGDLPIKYWSQGEWDGIYNINGDKIKEKYWIKNKSCYSCPIGCGKQIIVENKEMEGPEYETIAGFGSMILNKDLKSICMVNHSCNDYGMDTISCSSAIALLFDLYNKGTVTKEEIGGIELEWGDSNSMLELVNKIAFRKGIGNLLAEGSNAVGKKFNISKEDIATINNLEVPYHDIRACYGLSLTYAFAPRGACHTSGDAFKVLREENEVDFSSIGINKMNMFSNNKKMAKSTAILHDYRALYSSLICCFFSNPPPSYMVELINNLMGFELDLNQMKKMGERIFNLKRLFNIKMGLTHENEHIPKILLTPTKEGAVKGKAPDFEKLKKFYYQIRDWDPITGKPNIKKLKELGLDSLKF